MDTVQHPTLYKRDTAGKIRVWYLERQGDSYRTVAGIKDGNLVTSDWTVCTGKQGRTDEQQAEFEVASGYEHQLTREYHATEDTVDQPKFFKPMLAHKYEGYAGTAWAQPKLDGIRCLASAAGLFSREGKPILGAPHVMEALAPLFEANPGVQFDGELYNHDLKDDFNAIVSMVKKQNPTAEQLTKSASLVQYHIYDLPSSPEGFSKRVVELREILGAGNDVLKRVSLPGGPTIRPASTRCTASGWRKATKARWSAAKASTSRSAPSNS
jgi:DNA ligase-1